MVPSEELGYSPPSPKRIAQRALVLCSLACRADLEEEPKSPVCIDKYCRLNEWTATIGIRDEFETTEWTAISAPLGKLSHDEIVNMSWRAEGLAVLAWALYQTEMPPYDQQAFGPSIGHELGFLKENARKILDSPELRPMRDLEYMADLMLTIHWRLLEYALNPNVMDFVDFASKCNWAVMPVSDLVLLKNDLALRGVPLMETPHNVFRECLSIAQERHIATDWLLGTHPIYSKVKADT